jgi:hypothetical protein
MHGRIRWTPGRKGLPLLALAVASIAVLFGALAGVAAATKATPVKTTVKIASTSATKFTGTVSSPKTACEKGRKVTLYRQTSARASASTEYPGYEPVGTVVTDADGNWEADAASGFSEFLEGTYRPSVSAKIVVFAGRHYKCSPTWGIPTPA